MTSRAALALGCSLVASVAAAGVFPYPVHTETLPNQLKVIMVPMPSDGLVAYWSIVRTGSRDEVEEGHTGFAHFFEHMMFRGTENISADEFEALMKKMGADSNAYTTDDYTAYHFGITAEDLETVIRMESDRFQNLSYAEEVFQTEAGAVYGEYRKNRTNPWFAVYEALQAEAFDEHTYGHTTMGYEEDIAAMPTMFDYSKSFFRRFYRPDNVVLLVTGDIDPKKTMKLVKEYYGDWKPGYEMPEIPVEPEQTAPRSVEVSYEGRSLPLTALVWKAPAFDPTNPVMVAGSLVPELAFGSTSPLYRRLVLEEQMARVVSPSSDFNRDPSLWGAWAMAATPADVEPVQDAVRSTIAGLRAEPVEAERLDAIKQRARYGFLNSLQTPDQVASNLARIVGVAGDVEAMEAYLNAVAEVTPEQVQQAAAQLFTDERSTTALLLPKGMELPSAELPNEPVLLPEAADPTVSIRLGFRLGAQHDPEGKEGLAFLTATTMAEGATETHEYSEILDRLFPMAASYGVRVDKEMITFSGTTNVETADRFTELFLNAILEPAFDEDDLERLRARTVDSIENQLRYSSDEELGKAALYGAVFEGTGYGHLNAGTVTGLKSITQEDIREFYRTMFTQDRLVLGIGGGYDDNLVRRVEGALARGLAEGDGADAPTLEPEPIEGREVVLVDKEGQATAISFGFPIDVSRGEPDFYALWLATSWLGEHRNSASHLYQVIRETRGLNYGDYAYIEHFPNGGSRQMPPTNVPRRQQLFEVWIRPVPDEAAHFSLRAAMREVERLIDEGLTKEQFETTRDFLLKYHLHYAPTTSAKLGYRMDDAFYGLGEPGHLERFAAEMESMTLERVNRAIREHLSTDDMVIAMVTDEAEALKKALASDAPSPIEYATPKPAEVLEEDEIISSYPLDIDAENIRIVPVEEMFVD